MSSAPSEPLATAGYAFGEIPLVFECADRAWCEMLEARYAAFRKACDANARPFTIRYECSNEPLPADLPSPLAVRPEIPEIARTERGFDARTRTSRARVDLLARQAVIEGPRAMYPLDSVLRQLLPLLWKDGAVLHSAALAENDRGLLACGPSGSGKTTLATLVPDSAIADELAAVRRDGRSFRVVSLPFWRSRPGSGKVEAILFLRHGGQHRLEPVETSSAFRLLVTQTSWPVDFPEAVGRVLGFVSELVEAVPAYELHFAPREDVREFLKREIW